MLTILGARPQFIKAAVVSRSFTEYGDKIKETILHTGQHFEYKMDKIFFNELNIPSPRYNLNINSLSHGAMTGLMLTNIERIILDEHPDFVLVYGDTNSTLAGALAAAKLNVRIAHVEAGLRSFNTLMPEEINRILTDRVSNFLFCPTEKAVKNLRAEGFENFGCNIIQSGDVMYDLALKYMVKIKNEDLPACGIENHEYILCTIHREENTNDPIRFSSIIEALNEIARNISVVFPVHPRIRNLLSNYKLDPNIKIFEPFGYFDMMKILNKCRMVFTDSGGLQKESFFYKKNCIILRDETEWTELVDYGFNIIAGTQKENIIRCFELMKQRKSDFEIQLFGDGFAGDKIAASLLQ